VSVVISHCHLRSSLLDPKIDKMFSFHRILLTFFAMLVSTSYCQTLQEFQVPAFTGFSPSGRPGSTGYCRVGVAITDMADGSETECHSTYTCYETDEPVIKIPDATHPTPCDDESFQFYFPENYWIGNFSIHVTHSYEGPGGEAIVNAGASNLLSYENYSREQGYFFICGASGVCSASFQNVTSPIVLPFEAT
jgi:hypothetical protein